MDNEFDSEFAKLTACTARRFENGGVCEDRASCDIGWCADCKEAIGSRKKTLAKEREARMKARNTRLQQTPQKNEAHPRARRGARVR